MYEDFNSLIKQAILNFKDLKYLDEELYVGFKKFLEFEGDIENIYCKNFQIVYDNFGCLMKYDLKVNNKYLYYINYIHLERKTAKT